MLRRWVLASASTLRTSAALRRVSPSDRPSLLLPLGWAKAEFSLAGTTHTVQENPLSSPVRTCLDYEVKPAAVTMASRLSDCLCLASGEFVQLSLGHFRPTFRPTFERGSRRTTANHRELRRNIVD